MNYQPKYFRISEYSCKCGCGLIHLNPNVLYFFDRMRELYGKPMIVTSGCRCEEHNRKVGGSPGSSHTPQEDGYTYAMDIECHDSNERFELIKAAVRVGCKRMGIAKEYIHFDFSTTHPQDVIWVY